MSKAIDKPERPDKNYLGGLIEQLFTARLAVIVMGLVVAFLVYALMQANKRPLLVAVVDKSTGQTTMSQTQALSMGILEQQLLYYSRQVCEDYYGLDHTTIRAARQRVLDIMLPDLAKGMGDYVNDKTVTDVENNMVTASFAWKMTSVTAKADPKYSTYCQFDRTTYREGYKPYKESFNIKLDWGRLQKIYDPFKRPHQLVLLKVYEIKEGSEELKEQLSKVQ